MPKFKLKHSSVAGKAPLPADLIEGELALNINSTSPAAYIKDSTGAIVKLAGAGAVGATDATETAKGVVELATAAETTAGTDATRAVHPAGLKVELDKKAPLASPALTGTPTAPTATAGTNTTQLATTEFVTAAVTSGVSSGTVWTRTGTTLAPKTAGDVVSVSAGTTALPGLTPVGDPNTGIYAPAADTLAVSTNGTERIRVTSNGNISQGYSSSYPSDDPSGTITGARYAIGSSSAPGFALMHRNAVNEAAGAITFGGASTLGNFKGLASIVVDQVNTAANTANGTIRFLTNGDASSPTPAERLRITSDGKVGIGVTAPTGMIQVESSQYVGLQLKRNITAPGANAVGLRLSRSTGNTAGSFAAVGDGDACGSIDFTGADGTADRHIAGIIGSVDGTPAANSVPGRLTFSTTPVGGTAALERLRITSDGYLRMATGSKGIQFGGDTAAANALNDYEEGTFIPAITGSTTAGTCVYTRQTGGYTKVGNRVLYWTSLQWSGHTGTGNMVVSGLPFTPSSTITRVWAQSASSSIPLAANSYLTAAIWWNDARILLYSTPVGGSTAANTQAAMSAAGSIYVSGHYDI